PFSMLRFAITVVPAFALLLSLPAWSAELTLLRTFDSRGPSGLAYDDRFCGIWIANETRSIKLVTPYGDEIMGFESNLSRVDAIAIQENHLVLSDGNGLYQQVDRMGNELGAPYRLSGALVDTDGLFVDSTTNDYWVADDSIAALVRISHDGKVSQRIEGAEQAMPLMEPQGVTRDPVSGNLLVVDDADASDSLFEFSAEGELLDVIPLAMGGRDAEGITIQPETKTLFIAYDDGDVVAAFRYSPTISDDTHLASTTPGGCVLSSLEPATDLPRG
ncbi:MAG: hypothetical protein AAGF71_10010, partial [Pseudomonadota bacterium]